jgi:NAD-dependent dihydropyrimidine dehydrogenase PreA subunit
MNIMKKIIEINKNKCIACGLCVDICPNKLLFIEGNKCKVKNEKKCDKSKGCEIVCPTGAIKIN